MPVLGRIKEKVKALKNRALIGVAGALAVLGQTSTVDTSTMTELLNSMLPLIVTMIAIAIPIIFFNKIIEMIEKLLKSFS